MCFFRKYHAPDTTEARIKINSTDKRTRNHVCCRMDLPLVAEAVPLGCALGGEITCAGSMTKGTGAEYGPGPTRLYATTRMLYVVPMVRLCSMTCTVVAFNVSCARILEELPALIWIL